MSSELSIVALHGILIILTIIVQATLGTPQMGMPYLMTSRDEGKRLTGTAARLERATANLLIGFALFAAAVLVLQAQGGLSSTTLLMARIVLVARVIYVVVYATGTPVVRTVAWFASTLATLYLLILAV